MPFRSAYDGGRSMSWRIFRYEIPVDDQWHTIALLGDPLAVGCRRLNVVEFWARWATDGSAGVDRRFMVIGTGHMAPNNAWRHWGTAIAPGGQLVWHLIEDTS